MKRILHLKVQTSIISGKKRRIETNHIYIELNMNEKFEASYINQIKEFSLTQKIK